METFSRRFTTPIENLSGGKPHKLEIKNFVEESRKCQTLLANCNEIIVPTVFQCNERSKLQDFVVFKIFSEKLINEDLDKNDNEMIECLTDKIVEVSKIFNNTEIQLSVIWVYCFFYDNSESSSLPIFKCESKNNIMFVDTNLTSFAHWDEFIDQVVTDKALMCFPRHGNYDFQNNQLDLEYLLSSSLRNNLNSLKPSYCLRTKPFSQVILVPLLRKLNIDKLASNIKEYLKDNWFMLLSFALIEIQGLEGFLNNQIFRLVFQCVVSKSSVDVNKIIDLFSAVKELLHLLSKETKSWILIFESCSLLCKTLQSICHRSSTVSGAILSSSNSVSAEVNPVDGTGKTFQNLRIPKGPQNSKVPEECADKPLVSNLSKSYEEITLKLLENFLSNLSTSKASAEGVKLTPNDCQDKMNNIAKRCINLENYIFLEEKVKYKIYLFAKQNVLTLIQTNFPKEKIQLDFDESSNVTVYNSQGIRVAKLFFPLELYGICLLFQID